MGAFSFALCALVAVSLACPSTAEELVGAVRQVQAWGGGQKKACKWDKQCLDGSECTLNQCVKGKCESTFVCSSNDKCKIPICDTYAKCATIDKVCEAPKSKCKISTGCNPKTGVCETAPFKCPKSQDKCVVATCDKVDGCAYVPVTCKSEDPCKIAFCDAETGQCKTKPVVCDAGPCKIGWCNKKDGTCEYKPKCPWSENKCKWFTCDEATGACLPQEKDCKDGRLCTDDFCHPKSGKCVSKENCDKCSACNAAGICEKTIGGSCW